MLPIFRLVSVSGPRPNLNETAPLAFDTLDEIPLISFLNSPNNLALEKFWSVDLTVYKYLKLNLFI